MRSALYLETVIQFDPDWWKWYDYIEDENEEGELVTSLKDQLLERLNQDIQERLADSWVPFEVKEDLTTGTDLTVSVPVTNSSVAVTLTRQRKDIIQQIIEETEDAFSDYRDTARDTGTDPTGYRISEITLYQTSEGFDLEWWADRL